MRNDRKLFSKMRSLVSIEGAYKYHDHSRVMSIAEVPNCFRTKLSTSGKTDEMKNKVHQDV